MPPAERMTLAYRLLVSVELGPEPGSEAAWKAEIAQRIERLDRGDSSLVSSDEVFTALRDVAPDR